MTNLYKYILAIAFLSSVLSCKHESPENSSEQEESEITGITLDQKQFDSSNFELGKVEEKSFSKVLKTTGLIQIPEKSKAVVSTMMSGTIGSLNLIEGQWVKKGQLLFTVTNPELINVQEEYLITKGKVEYFLEEYSRLQTLSRENLSTKKELLKAKSELNTIQARHGALNKKLNLYGINTNDLSTENLISSLSVFAPISGYITHIDAVRGMYVEPNQSLLSLANTSQGFLALSVLEKDVLLLKKGQKVKFTMQGSPNIMFEATITLIHKSINENHMVTVNCKIDSDMKRLSPGMYANAEVIVDQYKSNALPESALVKIGEEYYALILQSNDGESMTFEKEVHDIGIVQNKYIEVLNGSQKGKEYLTKGAYFLLQ